MLGVRDADAIYDTYLLRPFADGMDMASSRMQTHSKSFINESNLL
jgi:hypothetical protein